MMSLLVVMTGTASAETAMEAHAGFGRPTDQETTGEQLSLLVGGAIQFDDPADSWSPRFSLDLRRLEGKDAVQVNELRDAIHPHVLGVRALAGIRAHGRHWFGQISGGVEVQRTTFEKLTQPTNQDPYVSQGLVHDTDLAFVLEPAFGAFARVGRWRIGGQLALAIQATRSNLPTEINVVTTQPLDVLATVFAVKSL